MFVMMQEVPGQPRTLIVIEEDGDTALQVAATTCSARYAEFLFECRSQHLDERSVAAGGLPSKTRYADAVAAFESAASSLTAAQLRDLRRAVNREARRVAASYADGMEGAWISPDGRTILGDVT